MPRLALPFIGIPLSHGLIRGLPCLMPRLPQLLRRPRRWIPTPGLSLLATAGALALRIASIFSPTFSDFLFSFLRRISVLQQSLCWANKTRYQASAFIILQHYFALLFWRCFALFFVFYFSSQCFIFLLRFLRHVFFYSSTFLFTFVRFFRPNWRRPCRGYEKTLLIRINCSVFTLL